jgi:hypothetical protein
MATKRPKEATIVTEGYRRAKVVAEGHREANAVAEGHKKSLVVTEDLKISQIYANLRPALGIKIIRFCLALHSYVQCSQVSGRT